jgi:hypothetical protein
MPEEIINITIEDSNEAVNITVDETTEQVNITISDGQPVKTSDLINDGEDGVHPFITLEDIPASAVESVTGDLVDNTDPANPVINNPTLEGVLIEGNSTNGNNINLNGTDAIVLDNTSTLKKGTYDFGADGGISRICGVGYEDMWQSGFRHVFDSNGLIRNTTNGFDLIPNYSFDVTLRFKVGSRWTLDNGDTYECTDATEGAAVWVLVNIGTIPSLQQVTDAGAETTNSITAIQLVTNTNGTNKRMTLSSNNVDTERTAEWQNKDYVGIADLSDIPAAQVNSDWNATSGVEEILNKPTIPSINGLELQANKQNSLVTDGTGIKYPTVDAVNIGISDVNTNATHKDTVKLSEAINKGQAVYISGANGTNILVSKASNTTEALSSKTLGLLETTGATNAIVNVVTDGLLSGLNTLTATIGDAVWLGTSGNLLFGLANKPVAPAHLVYIGVVSRVSATVGEIIVKIQNGFELSEIHNVLITSVANNQLLSYESSTSLWKNKSVTTADIASSTNKNYVTDAQATVIGNTSGTNTGDNSTNTNSNSYADAKVSDVITDGVTTIAPSQNAVFDALALKENALGFTAENVTNKQTDLTASATKYPTVNAVNTGLALRQRKLFNLTPQVTHTGTTVKTIIATYFIPANTFTSGDFLIFNALVSKVANISNTTHTIEINTTNTLTGAQILSTAGLNTSSFTMKFKREIVLQGGVENRVLQVNSSTPNDNIVGLTTTVLTQFTYNLAADLYFFVTCTLTNSLDSITYRGIKITD